MAFPPSSPYIRAKTKFDSFTPRAVLRYNFNDSANIYASFSKGEKAGAFNAAGGSTIPVNPEKIDAYEIGYKMSEDTWRLEASAFYYDYKDLQVNRFQGASSILVNAGRSRIYGGDIQFSGELFTNLRIDLGGAYTHAKYRDFAEAPSYLGTGFPGDPIRTTNIDASGNTMLRSPKFTGNAAVTYTQPMTAGNLDLNVSYYRTTKFYFDPAHNAEQKGYGLLNARATWTTADDRYSISIFGNNLTDTVYITQVLPEPDAILQQFGTPRTYGIEFGFNF